MSLGFEKLHQQLGGLRPTDNRHENLRVIYALFPVAKENMKALYLSTIRWDKLVLDAGQVTVPQMNPFDRNITFSGLATNPSRTFISKPNYHVQA